MYHSIYHSNIIYTYIGSAFLEIGLFGAIDEDMYEDYVPCGGIVTGIGSIHG